MNEINLSEFSPIAEINIKTLKHNMENIRNSVARNGFYAVVKSDGYGHGIEIAKYMQDFCDGFAVSRLDEAISLRFLGVKKPILMLVPVSSEEIRVAVDYQIDICCASYQYLKMLCLKSKQFEISLQFAIDCGMKRLGFDDIFEFSKAIKLAKNFRNLKVKGIYSHFSKSESFENCLLEFDCFSEFLNIFDDSFEGIRHISASGGSVWSRFELDLSRIGIFLYGYKPFDCKIKVEPIMRIVANSIAKRKFLIGEKCLYASSVDGGEYSLVNYGYADGLKRKGNPNRCMDLSYEKTNCGKQIIFSDAQKIADENNTIPYEVLVSVAKRIVKKYIGDI